MDIVTVRKRSLQRLCFYTCLSFCQQEGCLPQCMWDTPPGRHPPGQCMLGYTPQCMLGYTLPSACWDRHDYCCGWYASYWNAFLSRCISARSLDTWLKHLQCYDRDKQVRTETKGRCRGESKISRIVSAPIFCQIS